MKRHFDGELKALKDKLFKMGLLVEEAVHGSIQALLERDTKKAKAIIKGDQEINLHEIEIDEMVHQCIARYQPTAVDLRLLTMTLKITNDLERIGDQAVNIAEAAMIMNQEAPVSLLKNLPAMADLARKMVRESLDAFMEQNQDKAYEILEGDDDLDEMNDLIFSDIQKTMAAKSETIRAGVGLMMVSHNLERIGDLATNIAEDVIYLKRGVDIRHHIRERREE